MGISPGNTLMLQARGFSHRAHLYLERLILIRMTGSHIGMHGALLTGIDRLIDGR